MDDEPPQTKRPRIRNKKAPRPGLKYYRYDHLKDPSSDLRLIDICPGLTTEEVNCYMRTYTIDDCPTYEALSYAWGDDAQKSVIRLDSRGVPELFEVTLNLHAALLNLRIRQTGQATNVRMLVWIDALCIDQKNVEERNEQVQRMKSIYQKAKRVIVYLGGYDEPTDKSIRFSREIWGIDSLGAGSYSLTLAAITIALQLSSASRVANAEEMLQMLGEASQPKFSSPLSNIHAWAHLSRLFNRSWFERLWVIQELGVSQEAILLCGGIEISWATIENAAAFILRPHAATPASIRKFLPLMGAHRVTHVALNSVSDINKKNLLSVLRHTQGASCSDPRDKLYAVLGVAEDTQDVEIDYSKPVEIVYRDWAVKRILRTKSLDVLIACADSRQTAGLPSWVPDLRRSWSNDRALWEIMRAWNPEDLMRILPGSLHIPWTRETLFQADSQLVLRGSSIGRIASLSSIGDAITNLDDPANLTTRLFEIVNDWENWFRSTNIACDASDITGHPFIVTLTRLTLGHPRHTFTGQYENWRQGIRRGVPLLGTYWPKKSLQSEERIAVERNLFSLLHGCQMFATETDCIGIVAGSCNAQIGDNIYFLSGGLTPFILRRYLDKYRLISPCFLQKHMTVAEHRFFFDNNLGQETVILV